MKKKLKLKLKNLNASYKLSSFFFFLFLFCLRRFFFCLLYCSLSTMGILKMLFHSCPSLLIKFFGPTSSSMCTRKDPTFSLFSIPLCNQRVESQRRPFRERRFFFFCVSFSTWSTEERLFDGAS